MNNMRKRTLSLRKPITRLNVSVVSTGPTLSAAEPATTEFTATNKIAGGVFSQSRPEAAGSLAAINDAIRSAAQQHSGALSLDALLREASVSQIIDICRTIRGAKILTVCRDHDVSFTIHINEDGKIGSDPSYTRKLRSELGLAFQYGGTFIVRQYLPLKTQQINSRGEKYWAPWKNVYAFNLGNNRFEAVPIADLNYAGSLDSDGKPVAREQGVTFCEYRAGAASW